MDSSSSPPKVKSPLPMIPVPQALETVLSEAAKSLWFSTVLNNDDDGNITPPPHSSSSLLATTSHHHEQLLGRISAKDIMAPSPGYPNHNSSIMDGYAIKTSELGDAKRMYDAMTPELREKYVMDFVIVGKVYAGDDDNDDDDKGEAVYSNNIDCNQCTAVYVTTGAVIPTNYDAVIPIEDTTITSSSTTNNGNNNEILRMHIIPSKVKSTFNTKPWTWIRPIGCDIPSEYIVLSEGETIQPVHLALLAQVGVSLEEVHVKKLPRVGVLSTGNEVLPPSSSSEKKRAAGKIPDANRPLLLSQLATYGNCIPIDLGIVSDDEGCENTARRLNSVLWDDAAECEGGVDVLITTGGISMGEKDMMEQVFVEGMGGEVHFGRMNMKPGKPTTFITIDRDTKMGGRRRRCQKLIFALPGNPVSASVCSELLVRPCLDLLHDGVDTTTSTSDYSSRQDQTSMESFTKHAVENAKVHEEVMAIITSDIKLDQGRPEYRRVALQRAPCTSQNGRQEYSYHATHTGVQRSSRVLSLRGADGFMMLPRGGPSGCGYDIARKGMEFPVLLHSSLSVRSDNCWKDSMHRGRWKSEDGDGKGPKLKVGVIVCTSYEQGNDDFQSIDRTLVDSLGGDSHVILVQKFVCKVPSDAENNEEFTQKLSAMVSSPQMEGTNAIFVVVPTDPLAEDNGSSAIAFRAGLEVSHALRPILTKNAGAMALQVRKHAAAHDPVAALFENVVGIVRNGSAVLITCSDRGFEGAVVAVKGLLGYLASLLNSTD